MFARRHDHRTGCPAREGGLCLYGIVVLVVSAACLSAFGAELNPWEFDTRADLDDARNNNRGDKWDILYGDALKDLKKGDPDAAIERLRLAIFGEPESGRKEAGQRFSIVDYFPYWQLGLAFEKKGQMTNAYDCLLKERAVRAIASYKNLEKRFEGDLERIRTQAELEPAKEMAREMVAWASKGSAVQISAAGREKASALQAELAKVGADPSASAAATESLYSGMWSLSEGELKNLREMLEKYRTSSEWSAAFEDRYADYVSDEGCRMPGQTVDFKTVQAAKRAVEGCDAKVFKALNRAAIWKCQEIGKQITDLTKVGELTTPPAECAQITNADRTKLERVNPKLAEISRGFKTQFMALDEERLRAIEQWENTKQAELRRIPELPRGCDSQLGLQTVFGELESIRTRLQGTSEPGVYTGVREEIDQALANMQTDARTGVNRLQGLYGKWCKAGRSRLSGLDRALETYRNRTNATNLNDLCSSASSASREISSCRISQKDLLAKEVEQLTEQLAEAKQWLQPLADSGVLGGDELSCVAELHRQLSTTRMTSSESSINRAATDSATAESCLAQFEKERETTFAELRDRASLVDAKLGGGAGNSEKLEDAANLAKQLRERFASVEASALGDRSTSQLFLEAARTLPDLEAVGAKLDPFLALKETLDEFREGKVDGAIQLLRQDLLRGGRIPEHGRSAALGHAVLSYLLWIKSQAAIDGSAEVAELLKKDAMREAANALQADPDFVLPEMLASSQVFKSLFEAMGRG